ncbi:MAG: bifunctional glutamate N-acetyltransferase/amino-acid acetyltransferase ArgJ [Candidatus Omnitrophica bacterium]|nr:bifunctional glutamate N-acetyltransferase/amino-acid acetyltransferase ArgJ [Candidatus Omnitrophota bacterium]
MRPPFRVIPGSITAPQGFHAAGVFCDIKRLGTGKGSEKGQKRDLAILFSRVPAAVAGLFTTNQICAAPVRVSLPRAQQPMAQAVVLNSGNANACTGRRGLLDAQAMTRMVAQRLGLPDRSVLVCSTGRIGVPMPMANVKRGIQAAADLLGNGPENGHHLAEAIMTSDTRPKEVAIELKLGGKPVCIAGVAKGAGMIQPGMSPSGERPPVVPLHATMLALITTDAAIDPPWLKTALANSVASSFNRITIDGDMSTNDSVIALANGLAGNAHLTGADGPGRSRDSAVFQAALDFVCLELAKMMVRDGEGVSRFVTVKVFGARSYAEADAAARAVANSALVKTSWCGGDPNWGRILDALGYSAAKVVEEKVDMGYSLPDGKKVLYSLKGGQPTATSFKTLCTLVARPEFDLHIHLHLGKSNAVVYTADLTEAYVDFNKGSVGDPSAMGG